MVIVANGGSSAGNTAVVTSISRNVLEEMYTSENIRVMTLAFQVPKMPNRICLKFAKKMKSISQSYGSLGLIEKQIHGHAHRTSNTFVNVVIALQHPVLNGHLEPILGYMKLMDVPFDGIDIVESSFNANDLMLLNEKFKVVRSNAEGFSLYNDEDVLADDAITICSSIN